MAATTDVRAARRPGGAAAASAAPTPIAASNAMCEYGMDSSPWPPVDGPGTSGTAPG
jgi:hypothetical protein